MVHVLTQVAIVACADIQRLNRIVFPPIAAIFVVVIAIIWWIRRQNRLKEEKLWRIKFEDLKWDDPVVVLGNSKFTPAFCLHFQI